MDSRIFDNSEDGQTQLDDILARIAVVAGSLTDQQRDVNLLRKLVLAETDYRKGDRPVWNSLLWRVKLFRELGLLPVEQLALIEQQYEIISRNFSLNEDLLAEKQLMDEIEAMVSEVQTEVLSYRQNGQEALVRRVQAFKEVEKENPLLLAQDMIEFVGRENETWLDIAFLQAGTRLSVTGCATEMEQVRELAKVLMGDNSRVQRKLDHFGKMSYWDHIRPAGMLGISVPGLLLCLYTLALLSERPGTISEKIFLYLYVLMPMLVSAGATYWSVKSLVVQDRDSKQYVSKNYAQMALPEEVARFMELMLEVQNGLGQLGTMTDANQLAGRVAVLQTKAAEALQIITDNREVFSQCPNDDDPDVPPPKPRRLLRLVVNNDEVLPEEQSEARAPARLRLVGISPKEFCMEL